MHTRQVLRTGRSGGFSLSDRFDEMASQPSVRTRGGGAATFRGARQQRANRQNNVSRNNRQQNLQRRRQNQNQRNKNTNRNAGRGGRGRGRGRGRGAKGRGGRGGRGRGANKGRGRGRGANKVANKGPKRASAMSDAEKQREADKLDKQMLEYNLKQIDSQADLDDAAKAAKKKEIQDQFDSERAERRDAAKAAKHAALDDAMDAYFSNKPTKADDTEAPAKADDTEAPAEGEAAAGQSEDIPTSFSEQEDVDEL